MKIFFTRFTITMATVVIMFMAFVVIILVHLTKLSMRLKSRFSKKRNSDEKVFEPESRPVISKPVLVDMNDH